MTRIDFLSIYKIRLKTNPFTDHNSQVKGQFDTIFSFCPPCWMTRRKNNDTAKKQNDTAKKQNDTAKKQNDTAKNKMILPEKNKMISTGKN